MQTWKTILLIIVTLVLSWTASNAEFYRYIDANGKQRFTDDLATVPPDQRPVIKTYQSIVSKPIQAPADAPIKGNGGGSVAASSFGETTPQTGTWKERVFNQANELNDMQLKLHKTYQTLEVKRKTLAAKAPPAGVSAEEQEAYYQQVNQLNAKIKDYEAKYTEFKNKEKAFNDQYGK
jgi:hypothetical protein